MSELVDNLKALFLVDQQVRGLTNRMKSSTKQLSTQESRLVKLTDSHGTLDNQIKHLQASINAQEKQLAEMDARIELLRDQMNTANNNKEYSARLLELNTMKVEKGKVEESALIEMGKLDDLKAELIKYDEQIEEIQKIKGVTEKQLSNHKADVGDRLEELQAERAEAAAKIPPDVLDYFDRAAEKHDGEAMCDVNLDNRRRLEFSCGGCFMSIPVETVNQLATRVNTMVTCASCKRILYIDDELAASFGGK